MFVNNGIQQGGQSSDQQLKGYNALNLVD